MYTYREIRENFEELKRKLGLRGFDVGLLDEFRSLDREISEINSRTIELGAKRNALIAEDGKKNREQIVQIKEELNVIGEKKRVLVEAAEKILFSMPNIPDDSLTDKEVLVREWGERREYGYELLGHGELAKKHGLFSLEDGVLLSGSGFVAYADRGAELFRALIQFTLDMNREKGYGERYLPVVVNGESLFGTSQLPKFEDDLFRVSDGKYLSPTSEVQLVNLYRNKMISEKELPIRITANTNCFRKEAGAAGKDNVGVIRLHQFCKTEIVTICREEDSFRYLEIMVRDASDILEKLGLPYRVLQLPYNDMSFSSTKTYDIEVWFPSEGRYREISSVSNTLAFQSRRTNLKFKSNLFNKEERAKVPHILNGSSLAIDRLFSSILDNYQNEDGSISVPEALRNYLSFRKII